VAEAMSRADSDTSDRTLGDSDPNAKQATDAKHRTIEHGAEEYYRREGSPAEHRRAGQAFTGGDAEEPKDDQRPA
jgi:hypothetical protein